MNRRSLLAAIGASTAASTMAGCTGDRKPAVGLGKVLVANERDSGITVRVSVEKESETVYEETHELDGTSGNVVDAVTVVEEWMAERANYAVTVGVVGSDLETTYSTADAEEFVGDWGDHSCFELTFVVGGSEIRTALGAMETCPPATRS